MAEFFPTRNGARIVKSCGRVEKNEDRCIFSPPKLSTNNRLLVVARYFVSIRRESRPKHSAPAPRFRLGGRCGINQEAEARGSPRIKRSCRFSCSLPYLLF